MHLCPFSSFTASRTKLPGARFPPIGSSSDILPSRSHYSRRILYYALSCVSHNSSVRGQDWKSTGLYTRCTRVRCWYSGQQRARTGAQCPFRPASQETSSIRGDHRRRWGAKEQGQSGGGETRDERCLGRTAWSLGYPTNTHAVVYADSPTHSLADTSNQFGGREKFQFEINILDLAHLENKTLYFSLNTTMGRITGTIMEDKISQLISRGFSLEEVTRNLKRLRKGGTRPKLHQNRQKPAPLIQEPRIAATGYMGSSGSRWCRELCGMREIFQPFTAGMTLGGHWLQLYAGASTC